MCHFITGVLPRQASRAAMAQILREHALAFTPLDNAFVQAQLAADELYVRVTNARCDCGTPIGSARPGATDREAGAHEARVIEELLRKGWSARKIDRRIEQLERTRKRDQRVRDATDVARSESLEPWRLGLEAIARETGKVGLLLHWYRGGLATEHIHLARRAEMPLAALTALQLHSVEEDVLYVFRARQPPRSA